MDHRELIKTYLKTIHLYLSNYLGFELEIVLLILSLDAVFIVQSRYI